MLLFFRQMFLMRARVCVVHWHCTAQLSMFNMEKRYRNKIIIIIKLQIKLTTSPSHSILTPGQPVPALTVQCQAPGRIATGVPVFKSLV